MPTKVYGKTIWEIDQTLRLNLKTRTEKGISQLKLKIKKPFWLLLKNRN